MRLIKGLSEERLLDRIKKFNRIAGVSQRALGFYLLDFDRRGLYKRKGFASTAQFALMKLHVDPKKTRELLRIARALEDLTLIDVAFAEGRISWSAVREVTRVATKETEDDWLELARKGSLRKIEHAVSRARRGERPPKDPYSLSRTKLKVMAELPIEDYAVWKAAFDRLAEVSGGELDVSTALLLLSTSYLERPLGEGEKAARKAFQVVYHRCGECDRAWVETEDGPAGIPARKVGWREGFAEVVKLEEGGGVPVAGEKCPGIDAPRGAPMNPGNKGDQTESSNKPAVENAPRGARVSPGNNGDQAESTNKSAVETPHVGRA